MEYFRNETHQFCDTEMAMVLDMSSGKPEVFGSSNNIIGLLTDAIEYISSEGRGYDGFVVLKLNCVAAFELD